jgi:hypothetical protein
MDLSQTKLSKREWDNLEVPVSSSEKRILKLIQDGFSNVNIFSNYHTSLFSFTKIQNTPVIESMLYKKYFQETLQKSIRKYGKNFDISSHTTTLNTHDNDLRRLNSADMIRIQNLDATIKENSQYIFEFLLISLFHDLLKCFHKGLNFYACHLYTIVQLRKSSIRNINTYVLQTMEPYLQYAAANTNATTMIERAYEYIEQNHYLLKYQDITLFQHQKDLFTYFTPPSDTTPFQPKLVFYTAPTGTGKTLSPIGLSENYRVIFVCVARHIGLALAKSCISIEKKVAFAFGCNSKEDIRLHYFSAVEYTKHRKSGGIGKVDNSVGTNVQLMICDVHSYLTAMEYMLEFNDAQQIITYWDEPTITMDYENHDLHETIRNNWVHNKIPSVVLSCATLPPEHEIEPVRQSFSNKFENSIVHYIHSYDCRKSIPILNKEGKPVLPHYLYSDFHELQHCLIHCNNNKTLLRYFDLQEIIKIVLFLNKSHFLEPSLQINNYFENHLEDIHMNSLKIYYLEALSSITEQQWNTLHKYFSENHESRFTPSMVKQKSESHSSLPFTNDELAGQDIFRSISMNSTFEQNPKPYKNTGGLLVTTTDANTLTDGPTLFLCEDVNKIGTFYIQQTKIPDNVLQNVLYKITKNDEIAKKIDTLEREIEVYESKTFGASSDNDKKSSKDSDRMTNESRKCHAQIEKLRKDIRSISLDPKYIPNSVQHQQLWNYFGNINDRCFVSNIDEQSIRDIMALPIENTLKLLLLLGIGLFIEDAHVQYKEVIKRLAYEQKLYMIIASSDYIYGTNYQFCHGFIGKDLNNMTQQKTIQALGRFGRNNIQQDYTVRIRDDGILHKLFETQENDLESINMCKLFG